LAANSPEAESVNGHVTSLSSCPQESDDQNETNWKAEYAKLSAKFNALSDNFKKAREALQKRKDERDRWVNHAKTLEKKIRAAEDVHEIRIMDRNRERNPIEATDATGVAATGLNDTTDAPPSASDPMTTVSGSPSGQAESESTQSEQATSPADSAKTRLHTSNNAEPESKPETEPSPDGIVYVQGKSLRKRKRRLSLEATAAAPRIKTEPGTNSSSPILSLHQCDFAPQESIDLGEEHPALTTPRKRRLIEEAQQDQQYPAQSREESLCFPAQITIKPEPFSPPRARHGIGVTPVGVSVDIQAMAPPASTPAHHLKKGVNRGIAGLAEDGSIYIRKDAAGVLPTPASVAPTTKGRLDTLLNSPSPANWSTIQRPSGRNAGNLMSLSTSTDLPLPKPRELPFDKTTRQENTRAHVQSPLPARAPLADTSSNIPRGRTLQTGNKKQVSRLRNQPISKLRLDDFKINPLANEGHDFAYSDVVRDRDDRKCLPGCVDMHCCGKQFRALAESQRPNPPLTAAQRVEEQALLENYLGDYAFRLSTMTREERSGLWLEAKTQELANKYGKHRHRYSRMRSPPGFWNADFPSTQELEADRAESAQREKKSIQERYREATRPGGRWLFRDE
jgi:hypothetical protein